MSAIQKIRDKLVRYPHLVVTERPGSIELRPPGETSFAVTLYENSGMYTVYFDGWHEEMENEDEALDLLAMGLSDGVRLRVTSRGATDHSWTVETRAGDQWQKGSTTGLIFVPFWRRARVRYLQNAVITGNHSDEPTG